MQSSLELLEYLNEVNNHHSHTNLILYCTSYTHLLLDTWPMPFDKTHWNTSASHSMLETIVWIHTASFFFLFLWGGGQKFVLEGGDCVLQNIIPTRMVKIVPTGLSKKKVPPKYTPNANVPITFKETYKMPRCTCQQFLWMTITIQITSNHNFQTKNSNMLLPSHYINLNRSKMWCKNKERALPHNWIPGCQMNKWILTSPAMKHTNMIRCKI